MSRDLSKSGGSCMPPPSRSTVYVSNLPFSLTNTDIHQIFEKFGSIVRVTIMRNKTTRESKGVAFILFKTIESAEECAKATQGCEMFGRVLRANIAKDNGRAPEFIKRREYVDKSRCYECGELGHLSYACPKNILGEREPPKKKKKKHHFDKTKQTEVDHEEDEEEEEDFEDESLGAAIRYQQELREAEILSSSNFNIQSSNKSISKTKIKKSGYFSDEEEISD